MFALLITILVIFITGWTIKCMAKPRNFPPGPTWYPIFGCSTLVEKMVKEHGSQWKALSELAKEYGTQVLGIKLGNEPIVVLYGETNVRRSFMDKEFEGRPDSFFLKLRCFGKKNGITFADGDLWREHRIFTVKQLKNVGYGKTLMEAKIQNELYDILKYLKEHSHKAIDPKKMLATSVMNILWQFTAGERIDESRLNFILDLLCARSQAFTMAGGWLNQWPWMRFFFPDLSGYTLIIKMNQQISEIIEDTISKHKNNSIEGNDFMYTFLQEINENKETFTEEQLKVICLDIIIAGSQTTSNSILFAILTVLRNKDIQEKIYDEIINTIGDSTPSWNDSNRLLYTTAFLLEVQRYFTIAPLAGPRRLLDDVTIDGYSIPKDTTILMSVGDTHFDPNIWEEPDKFMPERFIDDTGKIRNTEHLYNFGNGRRRCPGETLAKSFIFIVFVGILQKFRIECSNGVMPSNIPTIGLISSPKPFAAEFIARC